MNAFILSACIVVAALVCAGVALWRRQTRQTSDELDTLRDEIWELRAAAAQRDRAEAASEAKSRFLATVSHEIRTPLNGVIGLAQLLAMTRLDAEQASYVEAIEDSGRALAQLIDDILDFSKIEAGRLDIRAEAFALAPLVEGVVELLAPPSRRAWPGDLTALGQLDEWRACSAREFRAGRDVRIRLADVRRRRSGVDIVARWKTDRDYCANPV